MGYSPRRGTAGAASARDHSKEFFFSRFSSTSRTPAAVLARLSPLLSPGGRLVVTTPHPLGRLPLEAGAALGLLSRTPTTSTSASSAARTSRTRGVGAGLALVLYRRFLFGMNQLAVFSR